MRNAAEHSRNIVRVWMRRVMEEKRWSANEWASMADTSPTNITRLLAPTCKINPSVETIFKLALIAGSQPDFIPGRSADKHDYNCNFCPDCGYDLRSVTPQPRREIA